MRYTLLAVFLLLGSAMNCTAQRTPQTLKFSEFTVSAKADLGEGDFTLHLTPENGSANVGFQIFAHRDDVKGREQWDLINPTKADGGPLVVPLYQGTDNTVTFKLPLSRGTYGNCRILVFHSPDGKRLDFTQVMYDSSKDAHAGKKLNLTIATSARRVIAPTLTYSQHPVVKSNGDGSYHVSIPAIVKVPQDQVAKYTGMWAMAKGDGGFSQVWVNMKLGQDSGAEGDDYKQVSVQFELDKVKPGIWNVQFGLFPQNFGNPLYWAYPGLDFESGGDSWVTRAPETKIPLRLRVRNAKFEALPNRPFDFYAENPTGRKAVSFVRGGNYGNAILWTVKPALNSPNYFTLLKGIGCNFIRFNIAADRYLSEPIYQHAVDQIVQNIWSAGLYPLIAPQDLPEGDTLDERVTKGLKVVQTLATIYRGKCVWLEVCNEPHEFGSWKDWKPVAVRYVKAIRMIDPQAFVVVPFEGWSKDGRGAANDPITETEVDLYDGHAYVNPSEVETLFGSATKAGLPVLIGEYGGGDEYLSRMDLALQRLSPAPLAAGPWAFTIAGQDKLPLVEDGSTAELRMTAAGRVVANDYASWDLGKLISR